MTEQTDRRGPWELRMGLWADRAQAQDLLERVERLLCPDPEHEPPCPIPWEATLEPLEEFGEEYADLDEQVAHEYPDEARACDDASRPGGVAEDAGDAGGSDRTDRVYGRSFPPYDPDLAPRRDWTPGSAEDGTTAGLLVKAAEAEDAIRKLVAGQELTDRDLARLGALNSLCSADGYVPMTMLYGPVKIDPAIPDLLRAHSKVWNTQP